MEPKQPLAPHSRPSSEEPALSRGRELDAQQSSSLQISKKPSAVRRWLLVGGIAVFVTLLVLASGLFWWYKSNLVSPNPQNTTGQKVVIAKGSTINDIARQLEEVKLIKSAAAFELYYRFHGERPLQAGEYTILRQLGVAEIVEVLAEGRNREYSLTFLPGQNMMDIQATLKKAGFKDADIKAAFQKQYATYAMMQQRPSGSDIEGFVFPDTYSFGENYTVENILKRPFDHMQAYITEQKLEAAYRKHGLTLYQGIILASIIQKEVNSQTDMAHVSQVFHSRLKKGMPLGSDPTFVYPAKKQNKQPHPDFESPYNTYKITGLPPGPIANPGKEALYAAAYPSVDTDDLYFVAGDDGKTHFSKTNEEHEALTERYCRERCRLDIF